MIFTCNPSRGLGVEGQSWLQESLSGSEAAGFGEGFRDRTVLAQALESSADIKAAAGLHFRPWFVTLSFFATCG